MTRYEYAKAKYAEIGIDTEKVIEMLATVPVSVHCWQGDDVTGFDSKQALSGGIQTTGNYPGKATTPDELMADLDKTFSLVPGKKKLNLHASYAIFGEGEAAASVLCETTTAFARAMAVKATGMPIEFFKLMPRGAFKRVAGAVRRHLNVESRTENHVMRLEQPRHYKGKEYRDIDLNGVADLNTLNESEAENRMAREGFVVTENSTNYLYSCVIAAMATGIPEEFFTTLPLYELLKLKNAVNDADFFG